MLPLFLILLRAKKQLQMKKVSVTSCCEKNKAPLPHLMDLAKSAGVYRRPYSLASPKIVEEGGRSSKHGWQQHIACDKRFVCLQDQNKHVHAQTTTTSQSAKVQDTGTQYTTTEEGVKPLRFQNTMWVKTKLSSSANVKRINRRRPSLHAHNLFSSAKKEAVLMSLNRKIKWKDIQKQVWEIQTPPFLFKQLQFSLKVGIMTVGERAVVQPRALSSRLKKTTTGTLVVRNWQFGTLHRS